MELPLHSITCIFFFKCVCVLDYRNELDSQNDCLLSTQECMKVDCQKVIVA